MSYNYIYLAPHYDDAALSCGGQIHQQVQRGETVLVITVCAAAPDPALPLSPFATRLHDSWGDNAGSEMVAIRRAEDEQAMACLGVKYQYLQFTDCIYRGHPEEKNWFYRNVSDIFAQIHPTDLILSTEIVTTILNSDRLTEAATIYAPLTVGNHVDHQLVNAAAWQLKQKGYRVVFYEDYPYTHPGYPFIKPEDPNIYTLEATLATKAEEKLTPKIMPLTPENLQVKIDSIRAYQSQLDMLFGGEVAMESYVRSYAEQVGQDSFAERIWLPQSY